MRRVSESDRRGRKAPGGRRAKPPARRRPRPRWQVLSLRFAVVALVLGLVGGGGLRLWKSGWVSEKLAVAESAVLTATARGGLVLDDVQIEGRAETSAEAVMKALQARRGMPLLALSPADIKARLETLPWVKSATVERRLPGKLHLQLTEHQPLALWQHGTQFSVVGTEGEVIADSDPGRFGHLLLVVGDEAPARAAELIKTLAGEPALRPRVAAAVLVGGRRWNLHLDNGIDVRLPEENAAAAWASLARLEREQKLLEKDLVAVDLRYPDRLVVRLTPDAAARRRLPAKST
jgi:cell division protein FtsQ